MSLYKGDFARIYFYMATAYEVQIVNWSDSEFSKIASHDSYKPYKDWQMKMLMEWSKKDPVSQKEINRNKGIQSLQENRNPFVDYPGLEEYIWGSMTDVAFSYDNYQGVASIPFIEFEAEPIYPEWSESGRRMSYTERHLHPQRKENSSRIKKVCAK